MSSTIRVTLGRHAGQDMIIPKCNIIFAQTVIPKYLDTPEVYVVLKEGPECQKEWIRVSNTLEDIERQMEA